MSSVFKYDAFPLITYLTLLHWLMDLARKKPWHQLESNPRHATHLVAAFSQVNNSSLVLTFGLVLSLPRAVFALWDTLCRLWLTQYSAQSCLRSWRIFAKLLTIILWSFRVGLFQAQTFLTAVRFSWQEKGLLHLLPSLLTQTLNPTGAFNVSI